MVKNTCFLTSFEGHILSPDVHPGNDEPYVSECTGELITLLGCIVQLQKKKLKLLYCLITAYFLDGLFGLMGDHQGLTVNSLFLNISNYC